MGDGQLAGSCKGKNKNTQFVGKYLEEKKLKRKFVVGTWWDVCGVYIERLRMAECSSHGKLGP